MGARSHDAGISCASHGSGNRRRNPHTYTFPLRTSYTATEWSCALCYYIICHFLIFRPWTMICDLILMLVFWTLILLILTVIYKLFANEWIEDVVIGRTCNVWCCVWLLTICIIAYLLNNVLNQITFGILILSSVYFSAILFFFFVFYLFNFVVVFICYRCFHLPLFCNSMLIYIFFYIKLF